MATRIQEAPAVWAHLDFWSAFLGKAVSVGQHTEENSELWAREAPSLVARLEQSVREFVAAEGGDLGSIEMGRELFRLATEKAAQQKADKAPPVCPVCQQKLTR